MRPLSQDRPKALIPTLDLSQLCWVLGRLYVAGLTRAWVNAHFGAGALRAEIEDIAARLGMSVEFSHEVDAPLGTAGALKKISEHLGETFIVANSDIACDAPVETLLEAHRSAGAAATVLAVAAHSGADFILDQGWVAALLDRRERVRAGHRYGGIGVFETEVLDLIPEGESGLYETVFTSLARSGRGIAAFEWTGYWLDVGTPAAHLVANLDALSNAFDDGGIPGLLGRAPLRRDAFAYVGADARVEGVALRHTVVGQKARIDPGTRLERCVVWDGATVPRGHHRDSVFTGRRLLKLPPGERVS